MPIFYAGLIFLLTIFTAIGDSFLKRAGQLKQTNFIFLLIGLIVYAITGIVWFWLYKHIKFSDVGVVYGICTTLVFVIVGVFYFHESLKLIEYIGIGLAITSMIILSRFG